MGKNLIQQRRGRGTSVFRAPDQRVIGAAKHKHISTQTHQGEVMDFLHCRMHSAPLAVVRYDDGELCLTIAPEGMPVGAQVTVGGSDAKQGNTLALADIPEGALIYNIEGQPGDGGKFVRSAGTFAKLISKSENSVLIELPSKKRKQFQAKCRATLGIIANSGRKEKPMLKAGNKHYAMKAKNKYYPSVSGSAMNAVAHPFGNSRSSRKSKARPTSRNAPPGRKVGMIAARRTGRRKK